MKPNKSLRRESFLMHNVIGKLVSFVSATFLVGKESSEKKSRHTKHIFQALGD